MTVDPSDDCSFWYTQDIHGQQRDRQLDRSVAHAHRQVRARRLFGLPRATISGTIPNCQTGAPIPNVFVSMSGGYSRPTAANGTYAATVPPGDYGVFATSAGYSTAGTKLAVANGGTAIFNACLNGTLVQPVADGAALASGGANFVIDPNETVTVNFGIKNTGTLSSTNLVGHAAADGWCDESERPARLRCRDAGGATVYLGPSPSPPGEPGVWWNPDRDPAIAGRRLAISAPLATPSSPRRLCGEQLQHREDCGAHPRQRPHGAVDIPLTVSDDMKLADVNVSFRINHAFDGDLSHQPRASRQYCCPLVNRSRRCGRELRHGPQ